MSSPSTSSRISESELERRLLLVYSEEIKECDNVGQSTQHIGDEWMRREIRKIGGFDVPDRWIKLFRKRHNIRYFSGRRHTDAHEKLIGADVKDNHKETEKPSKGKNNEPSKGAKVPFRRLERRVLRTSRREYEDVDAKVNQEIVRRQRQGERLTNPWIREYAQIIAKQLYPSNQNVADFFDNNWLYRFKRRNNVELKPRSPSVNTTEDSMAEVAPNGQSGETILADSNILPILDFVPNYEYYAQVLQIQNYMQLLNAASALRSPL